MFELKMLGLEQLLNFSGLLKGTYDGKQVHRCSFHTFLYFLVRTVFAIDAIKHATVFMSTNERMYMYLGEIQFAKGRIQKSSSLTLFFYTSFWCVNFVNCSIFHRQAWRLECLRPILWPQKFLKLTKNCANRNEQVVRQRLFVRAVKIGHQVSTKIAIFVYFFCFVLVVRSLCDAALHLDQLDFWLISIPCHLWIAIQLAFLAVINFFVIVYVLLMMAFFILKVTNERQTQEHITTTTTIRTRSTVACLHNRSYDRKVLNSLSRLNHMLKNRKLFIHFAERLFFLQYAVFLLFCTYSPFMVFFSPNPWFAKFCLTVIYLFSLVAMVWPTCLMNSLLETQVKVCGRESLN